MSESYQFVVSCNSTDFTTYFNPAIQLDNEKNYEMAFVNMETYYSLSNVINKNNKFVYSMDEGKNWKTITLSKGSYELSSINSKIQRHD